MVATDKLFEEACALRNSKGNLSGALEKVNQILSYDPDCIKALLLKSTLLRDMGEISDAREVLQIALDKIPEENLAFRADAHRLQGFLELLQDNKENALQLAIKAKEEAEKSGSHEIIANTAALLGNIYHTNDELEKAEDFYNQALEESKKARFVEREITVMINLATVFSQKGENKKALEMLDDILARSKGKWTKAPFNALFEKIKIKRVEQDLNDDLINEIIAGYKEAQSNGWADEEGNLAFQLGLVYYDLDQKDLSREYLNKALQVFEEMKLLGKVEIVKKELEKFKK